MEIKHIIVAANQFYCAAFGDWEHSAPSRLYDIGIYDISFETFVKATLLNKGWNRDKIYKKLNNEKFLNSVWEKFKQKSLVSTNISKGDGPLFKHKLKETIDVFHEMYDTLRKDFKNMYVITKANNIGGAVFSDELNYQHVYDAIKKNWFIF